MKVCAILETRGTITTDDFRTAGISHTLWVERGWIVDSGARLGRKTVYARGQGALPSERFPDALAAAIGAFSGILIAPITTIYYDSGFLIGLKGFVGAIIGGLASYPVAALGALLVGLLESYSSFYASAFKEVIVFTLIIPVLLWRSLTSKHIEEEEE